MLRALCLSWTAASLADSLDKMLPGYNEVAIFVIRFPAGVQREDAVKLGWAHRALAITFPGDTTEEWHQFHNRYSGPPC
jgi:hypothetical protein